MDSDQMDPANEPSDRILTVPNIISFLRLCLIPVFLVLLVKDHNVAATLVFAFASLTDCVDGYIARHFNQVSKLGQLLDPTVDRLLMISGAIGLIVVGRLPV
ncbi:MAG: CDP-alcohol phosphatidyltransferase family protein, partial [Eggerthellaceae bacterium]|nr:CDP-alcohol phosphatidyltransferase family protein [Eggerthellaceae bacterium]